MDNVLENRVKRFAEALSLALYDRQLELNGKQIILYLDADAVFRMIMGLQVESRDPTSNTHDLLARALFSTHFLGPFYIMDPHAYELNDLLHRQKRNEGRDFDYFLATARQFLKGKGIERTMTQLHRVATEPDNTEPTNDLQRIQNFVDILRNSAGKTFAYIEQTYGTWWQRLQRYYDQNLFRLDRLGQKMDDLLQSHEQVLRDINRALQKERPFFTINAFQDATALTMFHRLIRSNNASNSSEIVRFYTETASIGKAIKKDKTLYDLLSYDLSPVEGLNTPPGASLILRNSDYFIMRAWFAELAPEGHDVDPNSLENLQNLSQSLEHLLRGPENLETALQSVKHEGKPIDNLIDDFENLAITDYVWTRVPRELQSFDTVSRWTRVFEFIENGGTTEFVSSEIQNVQSQLESKVSQMSIWTRDFKRILEATPMIRDRVKGKVKDAMRDLGLVRWGYTLSEADREELIEILDSILQHDDIDLHVEAVILASLMDEGRSNPQRCLVACGILWGMGFFEDIVELVTSCETSNQSVPPSLQVVRAAARGRSGMLDNHEKRQKAVEQVRSLHDSLSEADRVGILLGVGYVYYQAWRLETEELNIDIWTPRVSELDTEIQEWARESFKLGEKASESPKHDLAWAYSINHCAYVGIITRVEPEKTEKYMRSLFNLENNRRLWNARFADTLGCYFLRKTSDLWYNSSLEELGKIDRVLSEHLQRAHEHFRAAMILDIGDTDLPKHIDRLTVFEGEILQAERRLGQKEQHTNSTASLEG